MNNNSCEYFNPNSYSEDSQKHTQQERLAKPDNHKQYYESIYEDFPNIKEIFKHSVNMNIACQIRCYDDILASKREFSTVLKKPNHPFCEDIRKLADILIINKKSLSKKTAAEN